MDKEINRSTIKSRQRKRSLYMAGGIFLLLGAIWFFRQMLTPSVKRSDLIVGEVREGEMENTVSANGTVEPSSELVLVSPLSAKIRQIITENGSQVKSGDPILILDTEYSELEYQRLKEELKLKDNNVVRLKLELEKNIRDIELDDQVKDLQVKNFEALLSDARRLQTIGGMTQEEVDKARQNLNIALLEKKKLENELKYRNESIASSVLNEQIQSSIQKKRLDELSKKLQNATIKAEVPGVITWLDNRIGTQVQEGDPLVRLANVSSYSIMALVSDMHADKISIGQPVQVEVNNSIEMGEIEQILPAVENNTIQFKIRLQKANSQKLRPKMKVPVRIITDTKQRSSYIPNGPGILAGKSQRIFVLENGMAVARTVELGFRTSDKVEVISGLKTGDKVVLSDMSAYEGKSELKVK
jgi:HlyD family secretion protein